jgi:hypothetical protein
LYESFRLRCLSYICSVGPHCHIFYLPYSNAFKKNTFWRYLRYVQRYVLRVSPLVWRPRAEFRTNLAPD